MLNLADDRGLPTHEPHALEPTPEPRIDDQQRLEAQRMIPAASGPKQMQAPSESDSTYASRTAPLLPPDAVDAVAVVVDVGRRTVDGQMRPAHLALVVARDS